MIERTELLGQVNLYGHVILLPVFHSIVDGYYTWYKREKYSVTWINDMWYASHTIPAKTQFTVY